MRTRTRTIGCFSFALTIALTVPASSAHAANDRARRAMAYADAQRNRLTYGRAYTGTRPFIVSRAGLPVRFREHQRDVRQVRQEWQQKMTDSYARGLGGG